MTALSPDVTNPFNMASCELLALMVAQVTGLRLAVFVHTYGELRIYSNHMEQVKLRCSHEPPPLPQMKSNSAVRNIHDFQ